MRGSIKKLALFFSLGLAQNPVPADQFHYINMLVGDRASGMGGAYVAVSDDPSGLYYNPAGIVYAPGSNLSASMNAFNLTRTTYRDVLSGTDWVRTSSSLLPNYFGVIQPLGPGVLGFSYAVPDSLLEDQDQRFAGVKMTDGRIAAMTINFNNQDTVYNVGPSYAFPLSRRAAMGITLYGYKRDRELILNQIFELDDATHHWQNSYNQTDEYGVRPMFGLMWSPLDKLSLGVNVSKTQVLYSETFSQDACTGEFCAAAGLSLDSQTHNFQRRLPWTTEIGAALFATNALVLSGQVSLYENLRGGTLPLFNAAAGMEFYVTPRLALRAGAYSDRANTPVIRSGAVNQAEHVDMYGGTLSLTRFTRTSSISVGGSIAYGLGEAQLLRGNPSVQEVEMITSTVYMSAAYSY